MSDLDPDALMQARKAGETIESLAERHGCTYRQIHTALKEAIRSPRSKRCHRGHNLEEVGFYLWQGKNKDGTVRTSHACKKCKSDAWKARAAKMRAEKESPVRRRGGGRPRTGSGDTSRLTTRGAEIALDVLVEAETAMPWERDEMRRQALGQGAQ